LKDSNFELPYYPRKVNAMEDTLSKQSLDISSLVIYEMILKKKIIRYETVSHARIKLN